MKISVSNIMSFSSTFRNTNKLLDFCRTYNKKRAEVESLFSLYLADLLKERIRDSIRYQKVIGIPMSRLYKPLSEKYSKRKPRGTKNKFYINSGFLYKNIKVYRYNGQYFIGFPTTTIHPMSKAKAQDILFWNEDGTKYISPRPLIRPHLKFVMQHLDKYWDKFLNVYAMLIRKKAGKII